MTPMKRSVRTATVGATAALLLATGSMSSAFAGDAPLLGTWSGHRERIASDDGYRQGRATLGVTEQPDRTFKGVMHWSTPEGEQQDDLVGAYTPGGELMAGSEEEGTYSFKLVNRTTLDYCYVEHGEGYRTTCARLVKKD